MRSRDIRFVRMSIMAQGGDPNKRWTLKWTRLLYCSLSASLNLRSGFLQIGLLLKRLLRIFFPAQIVSGCKEWPECDSWIYVFKWGSLCVMTICTIMTSSMIVSFAFLVLSFVIRLLMCACRLQIWHLSRYRHYYNFFESDVKNDWE